MRKITLFAISSIILVVAMSSSAGKAGKTGSPGESTCMGCHGDFPINTGGGTIAITSNIPGSYIAGTTYTVSVTVSQTAMPLFGFDFEALNSANANAGTLAAGSDSHIMISGGKNNMVHLTDGGLTTGTHTFTFNWTAPSAGAGTVTFYASGICADNSGDETGDYVHTTSVAIPENPLSVAQNSSEPTLNVYPTVSNGTFTIQNNVNYDLSIYNVTGEEVFAKTVDANLETVNLNVPTGMYFVYIKSENKTTLKKIIVQ